MHTGCQAVVRKHRALKKTEGVQMCPVCDSKLHVVARPRPAGQAYVPNLASTPRSTAIL